MPLRSLHQVPEFNSIFVLLLGLWGAVMNFIKRKDKSYGVLKKIGLFLIDILTSGGIAIITYLVVYGYTDNEYLSVGVSGVLAHMGTKAFHILEQFIEQKLGVKL